MGYRDSAGFTVVEMIVTIAVMSIFVGLLFQGFVVATTQRTEMVRQASAHDVASSNLKKITKKSSLPVGSACNDIDHSSANPNNLKWNSGAVGSEISISPESLTGTSLPSTTIQKLYVVYPQGCNISMPVQIKAIVTYGSETVTHVKYVN